MLIKMQTCAKIDRIDSRLVQTTSSAASCTSPPMEPAMTALDTATGVPNMATSAGYSLTPQLRMPANRLSTIAPPIPSSGARTMRQMVPAAISFIRPVTA